MSITEKLKEAIVNSGMSQRQICKRAGIQGSILSRFLSGERSTLRVATLEKLATVLKLNLVEEKKPKRYADL